MREVRFFAMYGRIGCKSMVDLVMSGTAPLTKVGVVIADIIQLMNVLNISISFVPKVTNRVADYLAKFTMSSSDDRFYYNSTLPSLRALLWGL
ncbi:hypothetical protein QYF36_007895 [Acer negundo]|nr:hypothetical protein QYF36_007895 [Acer negundo]